MRENDHTLVVGAGMAGLLAARVLADHFAQVTLVERDTLTDIAQARKGVPQGQMLHVLLPRGQEIVERLFPGYSQELEAAGAVPLRVPADCLMLTPAGWLDRRAPGWTLVSATRPLLEQAVLRRLRTLPNVTVLDRHDVTALRATEDRRQVTGAELRPLDGTSPHGGTSETRGGGVRRVDADLVVDAGGRGSRSPVWLSDLGHPTPSRTQVDPNLGYAARLYRIPDRHMRADGGPDETDWRAVLLFARPPSMPRTGFLIPVEDGQWMVGLMGAAGEHPPTDEDGFLAFARSLRHRVIADLISEAEPVTSVRGYRGTANRLWHYERMRHWPEGLVVLGDAVCAFNPIYGQGMSTAAVAADTLGSCLHGRQHRDPAGGGPYRLAARCQRLLARRNADPWQLSTGEDLRFPTTTGMRVSAMTRMTHRYLDRLTASATRDPRVADSYLQVLGMRARATSLFAPHLVAGALRAPAGSRGHH